MPIEQWEVAHAAAVEIGKGLLLPHEDRVLLGGEIVERGRVVLGEVGGVGLLLCLHGDAVEDREDARELAVFGVAEGTEGDSGLWRDGTRFDAEFLKGGNHGGGAWVLLPVRTAGRADRYRNSFGGIASGGEAA